MEFELSQLWYLGGVPLIMALTQICKQWVKDARWYSVISVGFGIILDIFVGLAISQSIVSSVIVGVITGLAASGLYSGVSTCRDGKC